ncbi:general substrate transporter [Leucosporidium creatinivorum]|uniref:General substrate transporter n=1 Tax=Leucosporidium creatinivorum TaxID=106004 RepID=A0A1Y2FZS4_9BASI|nr:general substrate transporter [Leucosporidium creatinivorum]
MTLAYWDRPLDFPSIRPQGTGLLVLLTIGCGMGFLLFGYDQGVMGGLIGGESFLSQFPTLATNATLLGFVVAVYEIGALFGSLFASFYGDTLGRRKALILGCSFAFVGGAIQGGCENVAMLIVFRIFTGLGIGVLTSLLPAFHAECAPARYRGSIVLLDLVMCASGLTISFWLTYGMSFVPGHAQWRFPLSFQAIFPLIVLFIVAFLPDSPRWLAAQGRIDESREVLIRYNGEAVGLEILNEIETALALESSVEVARWSDAFKPNGQCFRYRTLLAMGALFAQQATGVNMISYYSTTIFTDSVGLSRNLSLLLSGVNGINSLLFVSISCAFLIDRVGRVRLMWSTAAVQAVFMAVMAGVLQKTVPSKGEGIVGATMLFLFYSTFSAGWLGPSWLYGSEISPLATRSAAASLASVSNWIWNFVVVMIVPKAFQNIGAYFYIVFAIGNALLVPLLYFCFPETARLSLEEIDSLFVDGKVHVRRSPREPVRGGAFVEMHAQREKVERGEQNMVENAKVEV